MESDMETAYWSIVEFDDGVQLIPNTWIRGHQSFWPNFKSSIRFQKAVYSCEEPEETWPLYNMRILGTFDSYDRARSKLKLAEEQSDLGTENEETEKINRKFRKRKVIVSSEESDHSSNEHFIYGIPPFPKLKKTAQNFSQHSPSGSASSCSTPSRSMLLSCSVPLRSTTTPEVETSQTEISRTRLNICDETLTQQKISSASSCSTPSRSMLLSCSVPLRSTTTPEVETLQTEISRTRLNICDETLTQQKISSLTDDEFKAKVLSELSFIKLKLSKMQQFIERQKHMPKDNKEIIETDFDAKDFPLSCDNDVLKMEEKLEKQEHKNDLIDYLGRIGGYRLDEITKLILRRLFTD